ncbi:hypothetical protein LINPERPRIM_LOCUS702 [Linum perenne]
MCLCFQLHRFTSSEMLDMDMR